MPHHFVDPTALPSGSAASPGEARLVDPTALPSGSAASPGEARLVDHTALPSGSADSPGEARLVDHTALPSGSADSPGEVKLPSGGADPFSGAELIVDTRDELCPIRIAYHFGDYFQDRDLLTRGVREANLASYPALAGQISHSRPIAIIRSTEFSTLGSIPSNEFVHAALAEHAGDLGLFSIFGAGGYRALAYDALLGPVPQNKALRKILFRLQRWSARSG